MKVVQLRTYSQIEKSASREEPPFAPPEQNDPAASSEPVVPRKTHRHKRPSPVAVIAHALDGLAPYHRPHPPADAVSIIARAIERPAQADEEIHEAAFWGIWLAHSDYLRAHALRFSGGNRSDAEDALSEAMLKAANAFTKTVIHNQRGWLLRLVHNACMDHHRNYRRQSRLAKDIGEVDAQSAPAIAIQPGRSPEELLLAMEEIGDLKRALSALPKFLAEPLMLHLDDRSDAEIATNLNVTKEVVRKRRQMARELLRRNVNL